MNGNRIQIKRKQFEKIHTGRNLRKKNVQKGFEYAIINIVYHGSFRLWKGAAHYERWDSKKRILPSGESQRKDGRNAYKYVNIFGKPQFVYAWKLVPKDPSRKTGGRIPAGKRKGNSERP